VSAGSCDPPASDPKTQDCINKAETKAASKIDKKCEPLGGDRPECYGGNDGSFWVGVVEAAVDAGQAGTYCGSPSAAFLD
jgi:hypothetical protein